MTKSNYLISKQRHLTSFDIRAEILFHALLENDIDDQDIVVKARGLFYRRYSKDRINLYKDPLNNEVVNLEISRDGFYDVLPERISHFVTGSGVRSDFSADFKTRKKEEKEAREFFNPLENEFFRFKHKTEEYESDFLTKLNSIEIVDIIKIILTLDEDIPDKLIVKTFYALLKHNESVNQSIEGIAKILADLLEEDVTFHSQNIKLENSFDVNNQSNELILGINSTLVSNQYIFLKKYIFEIGPLKKSGTLENYFSEKPIEKFLKTFFNLFLPLHAQYAVNVNVNAKDSEFELNEKKYKSRLGISTKL